MVKRTVIWLAATSLGLMAPLCAHAQDAGPPNERILTDPTYMPLQGQIVGETAYGNTRTTWDVLDSAGAQTASRRISDNVLRQSLSYGVTDRLMIGVSAGYDWGRARVSRSDGSGGSFSRNGFEDPSFGLRYRVIDRQPLSLDLFGAYSPDLVTAKTATPTEDATAGRGGQAFDLGVALGHQTQRFTIQGKLDAQYLGDRKTEDGITVSRTSGYWQPTLGVATQTRLSDRVSIDVGADYNFNADARVRDEVTGLEHVARQGDFEGVNVGLNYHFIPNTLVGSVGYRHTFYSRTSNTFPVDPTLDFSADNRSANRIGAGLTYVFR